MSSNFVELLVFVCSGCRVRPPRFNCSSAVGCCAAVQPVAQDLFWLCSAYKCDSTFVCPRKTQATGLLSARVLYQNTRAADGCDRMTPLIEWEHGLRSQTKRAIVRPPSTQAKCVAYIFWDRRDGPESMTSSVRQSCNSSDCKKKATYQLARLGNCLCVRWPAVPSKAV